MVERFLIAPRALAGYVRFPRGHERLQGWSTAVCLFAFKLYMVAATVLITSFCSFCPCGLWASLRHHDFFSSSSSWSVLPSLTQFPPGRHVGNFAAFCACFTIGKSVSSSSSAQVLGACTRFVWAAQLWRIS